MLSVLLNIALYLQLASGILEQGKNNLPDRITEIPWSKTFSTGLPNQWHRVYNDSTNTAEFALAKTPDLIHQESAYPQNVAWLYGLLSLLATGCLLLIFALLRARFKIRKNKFRLMRFHAKQDKQQQDMAEQEVVIQKLTASNQLLMETRDAFLYALSDDLSNPLSVIKSNYLDWFQQARFDQDALEKALATESSIAKIEQLIQHAQVATSYVKSTAGDLHPNVDNSCNLNRALTSLLQHFPDTETQHTIRFDAPEQIHYILPVKDQVLLIYISFYLHLLVKHIPARYGLQIHLEAHQEQLDLVVSSDMPADTINPIPDPESESGYFLIASMGKQLEVSTTLFDSATGPSLLRIHFPAYITQSADNGGACDPCPPQIFFEAYQEPVLNKPGPNTESPKCLILDPCPEIQMCLAQLMSQHFNCKGIFNLQAGLNKIREWQPDIILMEPIQSSGNGFELLQELYSSSAEPGAPVIFITSRDTTANRLKALDLNTHLFFGKPFNKELLLESAIRLQGHQAKRQQFQEIKEHVPFQQSRDAIFLAQLNRLIETHISNADFRFEDYFEQFALSKRQFFRRVNNLTRCTPKQYLIQKRLDLARHLLGRGCLLQEVTRRCGFKNSQTMLKIYQAHFGEEPV